MWQRPRGQFQPKQGVYAIIDNDNLKQKASVWFVSLKVLEATFCVGVKTKRPMTRNPQARRRGGFEGFERTPFVGQ